MKKLVFFLFISTFSLAQKDGFWDKERAFTKEIKLGSGNRTLVKVDELPEGTSEFVYRISLIDENGKITTSLASVLKAIPDPTGISQGTAGAITLTNAVSGDDTCIYGIFTSEKAGTQFLKDGKVDKACYSVKEAINKDSKVISIKNTTCLEHAPNIWFAFENKNWVMSTKIVLEVVAWVDYKMSRGWNLETKKELMAIGERLDWYKKSPKPDAFLAQFMESFAAKYKYSEFKQLLPVEKTRAIELIKEEAIKQSKQTNSYLKEIRYDIRMLMMNNKDKEAIDKYQQLVFDKALATDLDYSQMGALYLKTKQFTKAETYFNKAISLNKAEIRYQLNLAHVYLFTDRVSDAKKIHEQYKNQNISEYVSWIEATKSDFESFEKAGLPTQNFKKILRILD